MDNKIEKIKQFAKEWLADDVCSAHNIEHAMRVHNTALKLAKGENVDIDVVKIAAILHDIGGKKERIDPSGKTDHAFESAKLAKPFLKNLGLPEDKIQHILDCIITHRYRTENRPKTKEAQIVFDADKLETIGATGIARIFIWVGKNNAYLYKKVDIAKYIKENLSGKINGRIQDKTKHSPQIQFETKDRFVLEKLYTEKAKEIAKERLEFSKMFLDRLEKEIKGEL